MQHRFLDSRSDAPSRLLNILHIQRHTARSFPVYVKVVDIYLKNQGANNSDEHGGWMGH